MKTLPIEEHINLKRKIKNYVFPGSSATTAVNILQIVKVGGTVTESLKPDINGIFSKKGKSKIKHYIEKLVSITMDGAYVNTKQYNVLMKTDFF